MHGRRKTKYLLKNDFAKESVSRTTASTLMVEYHIIMWYNFLKLVVFIMLVWSERQSNAFLFDGVRMHTNEERRRNDLICRSFTTMKKH